jgi:transcriptional regulator with XRE-family HTH domain
MAHRPFIRTLRAQWLGQELRRLREERGMTLELVAQHLGRDRSALSRYERGEWPIGRSDVHALLDLFGFYEAMERERVLRLAEEVWRTDHWSENYGDIVDASFIEFPWLESRAEVICIYCTMLVPGLLQRREYAETIIRAADEHRLTEDEIQRAVNLRMERQHVLADPEGPQIDVIIEEIVLRRRMGGKTAADAQLRHLVEQARQPKVSLRVIPADGRAHGGTTGDFSLFKMPDPYPAVTCLEYLGGQLYLESPKSDRYVRAYDELGKAALSPDESVLLIETILEA